MRARALVRVALCASLISFGCATTPELVQLAGRSCPPLPPFGQGSLVNLRVTFTNTAPVHDVVIQLLSVRDRCAHHVPVAPDGYRQLSSVPHGEYVLRAVGPGTSMIQPIRFSIASDVDVAFNLPIVTENKVWLCAALPSCADVLARQTSGERTGTDDERIRLLGYRLGIAMAMEAERSGIRWVACVPDDEALITQLQEVYDRVAPRSECARRRDPRSVITDETFRGYLVHAPTGRPARAIDVELGPYFPQGVNVRVSHVGPGTAGRSNSCILLRSEDGWTADRCIGSDQMNWSRRPQAPPPSPDR